MALKLPTCDYCQEEYDSALLLKSIDLPYHEISSLKLYIKCSNKGFEISSMGLKIPILIESWNFCSIDCATIVFNNMIKILKGNLYNFIKYTGDIMSTCRLHPEKRKQEEGITFTNLYILYGIMSKWIDCEEYKRNVLKDKKNYTILLGEFIIAFGDFTNKVFFERKKTNSKTIFDDNRISFKHRIVKEFWN